MKKLLSWALVLCLCLAMLSTAALADGLYTPGTYTGESSGHEAGLTVTVTVDENAITDVSIDVSKETATIGGAAGPALEAQILEAQSTEIDGVSGATETTDGVVRALSQALAEAQGNTPGSEKAPVQDGTFKGTAPGFGITGQMTCEVTFKDGAITDIAVILQIRAEELRSDIHIEDSPAYLAYHKGKASSKVQLHAQEMTLAKVGSPLALQNARNNLMDMEDDE